MTNGKITEQFLKAISQRLSGREDCKKVNYKVTIDSKGIHMDPIVNVYPNRYLRKEVNKMDIISYIQEYKMPSVGLEEFVTGRYEYQLSADTKNRRWRKLD